MQKCLLSVLFFFLILFQVQAQETCRQVKVEDLKNGIELDSLSGVEESIIIKDASGKDYPFSFDLNKNWIRLDSTAQVEEDFLTLCYRTFSIRFDKPLAKRTLAANYDSAALFKDTRVAPRQNLNIQEELFPSTNLYKTGSLTRGISVGNTQNVFVNSALNLQLEGEIAENLNIRASITDQNVPFQPEGNTQQIQDFDNVLIELYNDDFNLAAGDVVLQQRQSEFLRYYKNVQGLQLTTQYQMKGDWEASTQAFASIAKGKFASIQVPILEGVLGPYRLNGPNNERFVIIMANSERVFLDGKQLQRGFNADYVIDYNQAEITFTPKVLITQYSRVRVDFEYAERNYSRSIIGANHLQTNGKVDLYLNYYQEKDNRNRPLFTEFNQEELSLLAGVGDDVESARIPRIDSVAFDSNLILYEKIVEQTAGGNPLIYYQYSTDPEKAHFDLSFSQVGFGKGDYRRLNQLSNGTVYEYVPRINGQSQGDYSILTQLAAPDSKRMVTAGTGIKVGDHEKVYTELALSSRDENLFSTIDDENNQGLGWKIGLQSEDRKVDLLKGYTFKGLTEYEYNSTNFNFIDRFRYIEFDRDWGITQQELENAASEQFLKAGFSLDKDSDNSFDYLFYHRNRNEVLSGTQHSAHWNLKVGNRFYLRNEFFSLQSQKDTTSTDWLRYLGDVSYRSKVLVPGYRFSVDRNSLRHNQSDSVLSTAMNYREHLFYLKSNDTLSVAFRADAAWREDRAPFDGVLKNDTKAFTSNFSFQKQWKQHSLTNTFTYRELEFLQRDLPSEMTVMGKVDYLGSIGKNLIRNELSYALGNGRELQREFVFIPAPNGDGTHTWRDDNGDGIQQLNEFYLAINPEEKLYIKIFVPTDTYVQAYTTLLNYRIQAKFPDGWKEEGGAKSFLQKFSNTSSLSVEKKVTSEDFKDRINPFIGGVNRQDILSLRQVIRTSFFFNRASSLYGFDLSYYDSQWKQLLSGGFEDLIQKDWKLNARYNFTNRTTLRILASQGNRLSSSDFLSNRNYRVNQKSIGPEFIWQPSPNLRGTASYSFTGKENLDNLEFDEKAQIHQTGLDFRYAKAIKTTINANLKWIEISYNGEMNSPVGYEMLQALTPGTNITWTLNWLQKIGEGLQLNMVYEGRNSQGLDRIVHVGRMQVTALF
ncbi:hypothetical protein [Algoriphagus zhangzhouensis]|uniref:Cell surface protein SprA n=1 Tax=Algoriphagus zhangzhouensis TaxID=1073327 RepID=A0A1M7ZK59_9BACT|nr:hypothetical protein [Algoriphagus zhangzhouensis]TDY43152.1 hypothetical protein A8938_3966 [Algoriphagus zhangzhouensis]SHO65284.1 hypothetical protein SAMN04488108_3960 [Algoriphagus zhangzhouensis]